uniref:CUB domain-containing protein n=1 Tax=Plectus sambesii TaxID=2011161 RepID=A0A914WGK9_9BILA
MNFFVAFVSMTVQLGVTLGKPTERYQPAPVEAELKVMDIDNCFSRTNRQGNYRISGSLSNEETPEFCSVHIEAPETFRIEIVIDRTVHQICQTPDVKLFFEENTDTASGEQHSICSRSSFDNFVKISSDMSGIRIFYSMKGDQELLFSVRFTKKQL